MDKKLFEQALRNLKLDQGYFLNVPRDLLYLAMTDKIPKKEISKLLKDKYDTSNYQSLEFFGDKVLNLIGSMIIFQLYGLNITPEEQTNFLSMLVKNATLTAVSIEENVCPLIVKSRHCINFQQPTSVHNICSDSLEAIMGAIYYYGMLNGHSGIIEDLYKWFSSFQSIRKIIKNYAGFSEEELNTDLPLDTGPINWRLKIPVDDNSVLWNPCTKRQVQKKPIARRIPERRPITPKRGRPEPLERRPITPKRERPSFAPVSKEIKEISEAGMPSVRMEPEKKYFFRPKTRTGPAEVELPFPKISGETDVQFLDRLSKHYNVSIEQVLDGSTLYLYLVLPEGYLVGSSRTGDYGQAASDLIQKFI